MKTAEELGIDETTLEYLKQARDELSTGEILHDTFDWASIEVDKEERIWKSHDPLTFNMDWWRFIKDPQLDGGCGTVCCIGGLMEYRHFGYQMPGEYHDSSHLMEKLMYPPIEFRDVVTPEWAVRCIDKMLSEGVVDWEGTR